MTAAVDDELRAAVAALARPVLVGLDIDGTLSAIAPRPEDARLVDGALDALRRLAGLPEVTVAIVSGRALADVRRRFALPAEVRVVGSHGLEDSAHDALALTAAEQSTMHRVRTLAADAAGRAPGAWVEDKPAGIALHVRGAEPAAGDAAMAWLRERAADASGTWLKAGHRVMEVSVRPASKAIAVARLRGEVGAASVFYAGDDVTDEEVFATLGASDVGVRVGAGETAARYRVADPAAVVGLLAAFS